MRKVLTRKDAWCKIKIKCVEARIFQAMGGSCLKKYTYHCMHLHLHTCFQAGACMESQMPRPSLLQ